MWPTDMEATSLSHEQTMIKSMNAWLAWITCMLGYNVHVCSTHKFLREALRKTKQRRQCVPDVDSNVHLYLISSNKHPDAYFLWDIQGPAFKQGLHLFDSQCLLLTYFKGTVDLWPFYNCNAPTWTLSTSSWRPPTTAVMAFICTSKNTFWVATDRLVFLHLNCSTNISKNSLDRLIAQQTADW